jgi:hypothetical protein
MVSTYENQLSPWNNRVTCTSTATGTTTVATWVIWTQNTGTTSATCTTPCTTLYTAQTSNIVQQPLTAEEQRRMAEAEEQRKAAMEQRKIADAKAMELLRENLSRKQREALDKHGWFLIEGGKTKKTYRIQGDRYAGNITEIDKGKEVARYCVHADSTIPLGDQLLAQALCLKHDEDYILTKANRTALAA